MRGSYGSASRFATIPSKSFEHISSKNSWPRFVTDSASEMIGDFAGKIARSRFRRSLSGKERRSVPSAQRIYSLTPSGVLAENHPKNRGFVGILRGQKC